MTKDTTKEETQKRAEDGIRKIIAASNLMLTRPLAIAVFIETQKMAVESLKSVYIKPTGELGIISNLYSKVIEEQSLLNCLQIMK